jgi:hypothetical protein
MSFAAYTPAPAPVAVEPPPVRRWVALCQSGPGAPLRLIGVGASQHEAYQASNLWFQTAFQRSSTNDYKLLIAMQHHLTAIDEEELLERTGWGVDDWIAGHRKTLENPGPPRAITAAERQLQAKAVNIEEEAEKGSLSPRAAAGLFLLITAASAIVQYAILQRRAAFFGMDGQTQDLIAISIGLSIVTGAMGFVVRMGLIGRFFKDLVTPEFMVLVYLGLTLFRITGSVVFDEALFQFLENAGFTEGTLDGLGEDGFAEDGPDEGSDGPGGFEGTSADVPDFFEAFETVEAEFATYEAAPDGP